MVPTSDKGRFYAFGRIFSGVVKTNQTVTIFGPDYNAETKNDLFVGKKIQRTVLMMGRYTEQIPDCPCGNVIGLVGVDTFLLKAGTITELEPTKCAPFKAMKFSVSPVVRCAVECKNQADLPKLVEGLRRLGKSDPLVLITTSKTGEHVVAGAGELHLEICLKDLADDFMKGAPIVVSKPVVSFCETITKNSEDVVISKSSNKHNRVYLLGEPMDDNLNKKIEAREIREDDKDPKKRTKILVDDFKWNKNDAQKIWTFGCPPEARPNVFVDCTKGAAFLGEIRDHVVSAFMQATSGGVLVEEPWRGIRVNLTDIVLHADAIHRGAGQITPAAKKGLYGIQLNSGPRLLEPYYLCEISVPQVAISGVFQTLTTRRGRVLPEEEEAVGALQRVRAYLPVLESFGFTGLLRQNTGGKAFPQMVFDHWETLDGDNVIDINDAKTRTNAILMEVRKRKGLKLEVPQFADYYDRL
jgi:elongation factor 2